MQLNIYVPKEKHRLIASLEEAAKATGRPKNELVLEALEHYLPEMQVALGKFSLGQIKGTRRAEIYERGLKY
ncbi:MAG: ribbon-helix-helix protein, CopG family [Pelotomaculum sp.]|nr:ribbon-helix-helix protein, CopG family [Pelotomaculum sp.]